MSGLFSVEIFLKKGLFRKTGWLIVAFGCFCIMQVCTILHHHNVCPALSDLHHLLLSLGLPIWIITHPTTRTAQLTLNMAHSHNSMHLCIHHTMTADEYTLLSLIQERRFSEKVPYPLRFHLQQYHPMCQNPEKDTSRWRVTTQWLLIQLRSDLHTSEYAVFFSYYIDLI